MSFLVSDTIAVLHMTIVATDHLLDVRILWFLLTKQKSIELYSGQIMVYFEHLLI